MNKTEKPDLTLEFPQPVNFYLKLGGYCFSLCLYEILEHQEIKNIIQDAHINKAERQGTICDWQNHTVITWGWTHCISECCITNTHLPGWNTNPQSQSASATVTCAGKHNPGCSSPPKIFEIDHLGTFTAVCTTLLHSTFPLGLICNQSCFVTHPVFSSPVSVFNLQFLKADSNCKQQKRYLSLASKHNGVLFFQHSLHWGVNEKKNNMYWVHLRTVQQLQRWTHT